MRYIALFVGLIVAAIPAGAFEIENQRRFGPEQAEVVLRILSTADTSVFAPIVLAYLDNRPNLAVDYIVASSGEVMRALEEPDNRFDVVISSAMDLQTKLANDGHALSHRSSVTQEIPEWAHWRDHLFAFTREPAAIVLSPMDFEDIGVPGTRQELMALMRQHPDRFRGRIGTYDIRQSGLGYLFATQDARTSETYWRLTEIMGFLDAQLYCCSSDMINDVASGKLAVAYNALGSYARARDDADEFHIVYPQDFTTVMLRTALIPRNAPSPEEAGNFLDHILEIAWLGKTMQGFDLDRLPNEDPDAATNFKYIRLGPGLLVHLDRLKKKIFLSAWENAFFQN